MNAIPFLNEINTQGTIKKISNNFSITVATVNGSGSQTSNLTILRALFKMGIPVSGKNIFPSNIQGLPTWYTIRVNRDGFTARTEDSEIVVAMNPSSFTKDLDSLIPGGVFLYADDIRIPITRQDIYIYPMPVKRLIRESEVPTNLRDFASNMVYVGVLAYLLGIDLEKIKQALEFHFKGKSKPIELNLGVVMSALIWADANLDKQDPYYVESMDLTNGLIMTDGNTAAAIGAIYGGVHFVSWYPITPATSLAESLHEYLPKLRKEPDTGKNTFAIVQAEDELAAIGMAIGAGWAGLRSMTSTSGPGLSLMTEYLGLGYFAEVPVVVWDVQRVGPSTGLPTRTSQGDLTFVNFMGHGDTQTIILLPGSINEIFEFGWKSFDLAERFQTPVIVLSDLDFGMNQWMARPFEYPDQPIDRGKVLWEDDLEKLNGKWARYQDIDGDGIPYRTVPGNRNTTAAYFTRGTGHDENARYSEDPEEWYTLLIRLKNKFLTLLEFLPKPVIDIQNDAEIGFVAFGSTESAIKEARHSLAKDGIKTDFLRIRALPFISEIENFLNNHRQVFIVELNRDGQMKQLLTQEYPEHAKKFHSIAHSDGLPITARRIVDIVHSFQE